MNADFVDIVARFRIHLNAVTPDIEKAFLQVSVRLQDRGTIHFLWVERHWSSTSSEPGVEEWRMTRSGHLPALFCLPPRYCFHQNALSRSC